MKQPKIRRRCRSISSEKTDRKRHEANEVKTPRTEVPNEIRVVSGRESFVPIDTASVATPFHLICIIISPDMDISRCSHLVCHVSCFLQSWLTVIFNQPVDSRSSAHVLLASHGILLCTCGWKVFSSSLSANLTSRLPGSKEQKQKKRNKDLW